MRIRTVDAFAARPYTGNPAAVVLFRSGPFPGDERLRTLAAEMNLAETAYARPLPEDPDADWELRWFTPVAEVDLCGHATVATAHLLAEDGLLAPGAHVRFRTRSGVLGATVRPCGDVTLDFPTSTPVPVEIPPGLAAALGTRVTAAYDTAPMDYLLAEAADEQTVRGLAPDLTAVAALEWPAVIVTARADGASRTDGDGDAYDFVSRMFAPRHGIPEDPVTGSAHTALAPLWAPRLGSDRLTGFQASARSGYVRTELRGTRTLLTGSAVTVLDAELRTPL